MKLYGTFRKAEDQPQSEKYIYIEGYASTSAKDRHGDIIPKSAWSDEVLNAFKENNPIMLFNHDYNIIAGHFTEVTSTDEGLYVKGKVKRSFQEADSVEDGILKSFSINFITEWKNYEYKAEAESWVVTKIDDLLEISLVSVPAEKNSTFSVSKSLGKDYEAFKKSHQKKNMSILESFKSLFAKSKEGNLTEDEQRELDEIKNEIKANEPEVETPEVENQEEPEQVADEVEQPEMTASDEAIAKAKKLEEENEALKARLAKAEAKSVKVEKAKDPNPTSEEPKMTARQKALEENAEAVRNYKR